MGSNVRVKLVRGALRETPDGMTVTQIVEALGHHRTHVGRILNAMPDAYIDRWIVSAAGDKWWQAVWCVIVPPENCPRPVRKKK